MYFRLSWIILFALFSSENAYAQPHRLDSLKHELNNHPDNDTSKVLLIYDIAFDSFRVDVNQSKKYLKRIDELSDSLNFTLGKAKSAYLNGVLANQEGEMEKSLEYFKLAGKYYESINDKKGGADVYVAFGIIYYMTSQYDKALLEYDRAYEIYIELKMEKDQLNVLANMANVYSDLGRYDEAIKIYKKELKINERKNDKNGVKTSLHSLGSIYQLQGNYPLAIEYFNKALNCSKASKDTFSMAMHYNGLGDVYSGMNQFEKALLNRKKSLSLSINSDNKRLLAVNYSNIGSDFLAQRKLDKALNNFKIALEICQEVKDVRQTAIVYRNIGVVFMEMNQNRLARNNYIKAKGICDSIGFRRGIAFSLIGLGETYLIEKKYTTALSLIIEGKEIADELQLLKVQKKSLELLSNVFEGLGRHKDALAAFQEFKAISDSIFNQENLDEIAKIEYEYKYKQEIDSANIRELKLSKEVLLTKENLEVSKQKNLWAVISILALILIAGGIIVFLRLRNLNAKTQNIQMEQKLLRSQMTPHFIFNSLSVLQGMILNKEEKKSVSYLSKFSKLLRLTLENSRDKEVLLKDELDAVRNYLALQNLENTSYNFDVVLDESIKEDRFKIPPMLVQPFIENSIEHAFSNQQEDKRVSVELSFENNQLICQILDNGVGIDSSNREKNTSKNSLSTTISAERLQILSKHYKMTGSVTIEDRKRFNEKGTIVTLVIPYKIDS